MRGIRQRLIVIAGLWQSSWGARLLALASFASAVLAACQTTEPPSWPSAEALSSAPPAAPQLVAGVPVSASDYHAAVRWGADWFRYETFGGERMVTDVVGMLNARIQVPCVGATPTADGSLTPRKRNAADCYQWESSLPYVARALDALDGVPGNLYVGNGGFEGTGYTHDLVIRFPPGSRLHGLPLPEAVHTGLDVEAGSAWPIGISPVPVSGRDAVLPYVWDLGKLGVGPAPQQDKVRIGFTCAMCHYSLDLDWDGQADLKSARMDRPTPGSRYRPEHAWAVGNQDLKVGWLFALSQNPVVGFSIFSGPIGNSRDAAGALEWVKWVKENYRTAPAAVAREVVRGMLLQPRGYADVTSNARYNANQFAPLYTQRYWPSNSDGAVLNPADRNSVVWTSTLDFSGLVGLTRDRGGGDSDPLYWEEKSIYSLFTAAELADLLIYSSPAKLHDSARGAALREDILGTSDGVPSLLDPDSLYVMRGPGNVIPERILNHPLNKQSDRIREPKDFGGDAELRGPVLSLLGMRVRTRPAVLADAEVSAFLKRHPSIRADELMSEAVNAMLDWQPSPPNLSQRLARAADWISRGREVFLQEGCANCHRGPFFTDNRVHRLSNRRKQEVGVAAASNAAWRSLGRGSGPAIGTDPVRTVDSRILYLYVSPEYDASTGRATSAGGPLRGFFGTSTVGYKTSQLRYLWGSAPYLHDGGVGVSISPDSQVDREDLAAVLALPTAEKVYGMGRILAEQESRPALHLRADAALSLQALLLKSERAKLLAERSTPVVRVPGADSSENPFNVPDFVSAEQLGIVGEGHDFYIDDQPGGDRITGLIAFLLALDDEPRDLPSRIQQSGASKRPERGLQ